MESKTSKSIYLVDILNGGHRDAFMQLFAKSLLEMNHRVVCIMPDTSIIETWINKYCKEYVQNISYYNLNYPKSSGNVSGKWQTFKRYLYVWNYYKKHIRTAAEKYQLPVDLVFYNCIDGHLSNYLPHQLIDLVFPYKWSGLYFHPNHLRAFPDVFKRKAGISDVDYGLLAKNCTSIAIHDEGVLTNFSRRLNGKKVVLFPEIADVTPPDPSNSIANEIKEKANGRIVLGMIGLEPYKGSYHLMRLAKEADPEKYMFAFCGHFDDYFFRYFESESKAEEFWKFKDNLPEHCYWNNRVLTEGADYNSVINSFDIIFLVYRNFYSSSNRLTKAANFHKLVLSSDKHCVGEDVLRYHLGETVSDTNTPAMLSALEKLHVRIKNKDFPYDDWKVYAQKHSEAVLQEKFKEIIALI